MASPVGPRRKLRMHDSGASHKTLTPPTAADQGEKATPNLLACTTKQRGGGYERELSITVLTLFRISTTEFTLFRHTFQKQFAHKYAYFERLIMYGVYIFFVLGCGNHRHQKQPTNKSIAQSTTQPTTNQPFHQLKYRPTNQRTTQSIIPIQSINQSIK